MTGSGKTHTMLGDIYRTTTGEKGVSSLAIDSLFKRITQTTDSYTQIKISYLEIYNEQVKDLLANNSSDLMIIEDPVKGVIVPELTEHIVINSNQILSLILKGNERRIMAATSVNQFSSRSHAILQIMLETVKNEITMMAKLSLVDLAGSECSGKTETKGIRMIETGKINKSLLALGTCIKILTTKSRNTSFVPYRDSKLTRLLKDSLGGNAKTIMIACVSPYYYEETLNTLNYAERAKKIKNKVCRHIKEREPDIGKYKKIIQSLKNEIAELKEKLKTKIYNEDSYFHPLSITKSGTTEIKKDEAITVKTPSLIKIPMLTGDMRSSSCEKEFLRRSREKYLIRKSFDSSIMGYEGYKAQFATYENVEELNKTEDFLDGFDKKLNQLLKEEQLAHYQHDNKKSVRKMQRSEETKELLTLNSRGKWIKGQKNSNNLNNVNDTFHEGTSSFENLDKKSVENSFINELESLNAKKLLLSDLELEDTKLQLKEMKKKLKVSEEEARRQAEELKEMTKYKELYNNIIKNFPQHNIILANHNSSNQSIKTSNNISSVGLSKVSESKVIPTIIYQRNNTQMLRKRRNTSSSSINDINSHCLLRRIGIKNNKIIKNDVRGVEAIKNFIEYSNKKPELMKLEVDLIAIPDNVTRNKTPILNFAKDLKSPKVKNKSREENVVPMYFLNTAPTQCPQVLESLENSATKNNHEWRDIVRKNLSTSTIIVGIPQHRRAHIQHLENSKMEFERVSISITSKVTL